MYARFVFAIAMVFASAPLAAQSSLWSATMTTDGMVSGNGTPIVGYIDFTSLGSSGALGTLSDVDFEFQGTTHTVQQLNQFQAEGDNSINLVFSPPLSEEVSLSFTLTVDGQALVPHPYGAYYPVANGGAVSLIYDDPGFQWTVGQRVAVTLTAPTSTPALPLVGAGLLALLLGAGAYRRHRRA